MSGIKKGEQLGQTLDGGQVTVVGGTGAGVIGKAHILVRRTSKHQQDIQIAVLELIVQAAQEAAELTRNRIGSLPLPVRRPIQFRPDV